MPEGRISEGGVAYAAAGIVSHDGTHVFALDAASGELRWHNGASGNLLGENDVVGVSASTRLDVTNGCWPGPARPLA